MSKGKRLKPVLLLGNQLSSRAVHFLKWQVNIDLVWGKKRLECSRLFGVIDKRPALDWIEDCSVFGDLVASGSTNADSLLTALDAKELG